MKRTTIIPTLVAASLLAAACSSTDPDSPDAEPASTDDANGDGQDDDTPIRRDDPIRSAKVALQQFDRCDSFLDYVHTEGAERVGAYGFDDAGYFGRFEMDGMEMDDMAMDDTAMEETALQVDAMDDDAMDDSDTSVNEPMSADGAAAGSGGDSSFSTTNVQVEGVDEPDIVKTDGERILALAGERLHYVSVDAGDGTSRGSISLRADETERGGYFSGQEILVSGDRAFVIGRSEYYGGFIDAPAPLEADVAPSDGDAESQFASDPIPTEPFPDGPFPGGGPERYGPTTVVVEIDLSNPDDLRVVETLTLEGRYISARAIGETVRVAVTTSPQDLGFLYPSSRNAEEAAIEANQELVRRTTVEDWVPSYTLTSADGTSSGRLVDCEGIHAPAEFAGFDMLSVVTLSLGTGLDEPSATTSVMARGETVYSSQDRMYIATNEWMPPTLDDQELGIWEETYQTGIHRFLLPADEPAVYEASGTVDGHLLNQFSMNDRDGTFFVATTTGTPWSSEQSESQIVSMQATGDRLEQVGVVGGLGKGEQIFSVRYVDDVAYVVTFRQTDPFYVIDLSSPDDMSVLGELKIPGVSNYLHPISDTLVLGVGQDATDEGFQTGSKVSLFDVTDPGDPIELDVWTLPNSNSDAEFDHRAFLWWADSNTAVLPLTQWETQFSGAVVLDVTADGITERGRITHVEEDRDEPGITDCDIFDGSELTEADGEMFWITQEDPNSRIQLCGPDDRGGATGYYCEVIPVDEIDNWFYIGDDSSFSDRLDLDDVDRIEWCWLDGGVDWQKQIRRTLVIDGDLWTLSNERLQANDLDTLETSDVVKL